MFLADTDALDRKADAYAAEMANKENEAPTDKHRAQKLKDKQPGAATARQVAQALGERAPLPPALVSTKKLAQQLSQESSRNHAEAQNSLEARLLTNVKRSLFVPSHPDENGMLKFYYKAFYEVPSNILMPLICFIFYIRIGL